jgi:hypothetical protein
VRDSIETRFDEGRGKREKAIFVIINIDFPLVAYAATKFLLRLTKSCSNPTGGILSDVLFSIQSQCMENTFSSRY